MLLLQVMQVQVQVVDYVVDFICLWPVKIVGAELLAALYKQAAARRTT